jgi:hypothetical protein
MFTDMFEAMEAGRPPRETFYDGYVVNAIIDACYASAGSKRWEPVALEGWRGRTGVAPLRGGSSEYDGHLLVKRERMPDGRVKLILKDRQTGAITQRFADA